MDQTPQEEIANSVTHGIGLLLSIVGLVVLVVLAAVRGTVWHVVSCSVYGATLVLLYFASTLYHGVPSMRVKRVLRAVDHASIYLLIAGTYTPFLLVSLRGAWGWSLFGVVWGIALVGMVFKMFFTGRFKIVSSLIYVAMGWLVVVALKPLLAALPRGGVGWLLAGGLFYTSGVVFYVSKRLAFSHGIWHGFVLAGSICHFLAIMLYVVPSS